MPNDGYQLTPLMFYRYWSALCPDFVRVFYFSHPDLVEVGKIKEFS